MRVWTGFREPTSCLQTFDQNGSMWSYATSRGPCFPWHRPWGRLLKRTKYRMDWPSGVSTHGWLAHCPLLTCPMYCGSLQAGMMYFGLTASNKRVKWAEPQWAFGEPAKVWPTSLPAAHMLPPCIVLWSRHMLPVRCPFLLRQLLKRHQRNPLSPCQRQLFSTIWQWQLIS